MQACSQLLYAMTIDSELLHFASLHRCSIYGKRLSWALAWMRSPLLAAGRRRCCDF
ncbi:MAG: hypothetical protein AAGF98_14980 [Cyanobacteria bacterium P01_H01_bin.153]